MVNKTINYCGMELSIPRWVRETHPKKKVNKKRQARIKKMLRLQDKQFLGDARRIMWATQNIFSLKDLKAYKEQQFCVPVQYDVMDNVIGTLSHMMDVFKWIQNNPHQSTPQA